MNPGIITKISFIQKGKLTFYIRLDRNVKDGDKEINIFLYEEDDTMKAKLIETNSEFTFPSSGFSPVSLRLGEKYDFEIEGSEDHVKIVSVSLPEKR